MKKLLSLFFFITTLACVNHARADVTDALSDFFGSENAIVDAIKARETTWVAGFKKLADSEKNMQETMSALEDVRIQQKVLVEQSFIENEPDLGNDLANTVAGATYWSVANEQNKEFADFLDDSVADKLSSEKTSSESVEKTVVKLVPEQLNSYEDYEIKKPLSNANTLYKPKTYQDISSTTEENTTGIEKELLNATNFSQLLINPYNTEPKRSSIVLNQEKGIKGRTEYLTKQARKSLAYTTVNEIMSSRTNIKNGGLGSYIKDYVESIEEETKLSLGLSDLTENMGDDISRYEFMDSLFASIYMNPAWLSSLEKLGKKGLRRKKIELFAFINMLNWENSKMLEKLTALSATELVTDKKTNLE